MNPSASGWIKKLQVLLEDKHDIFALNPFAFYDALRTCGFIYGANVNTICKRFSEYKLTEAEICKVNLYIAFSYTYKTYSNSKMGFTESVIAFYNTIDTYKAPFFKGLFGHADANTQLEEIIHKRLQIDDNILTKNFNDFLINGFLYIDILAYQVYLENASIALLYFKKLEASIAATALSIITSKAFKTGYDENLLKFFEASQRYHTTTVSYNEAVLFFKNANEKYYVIDVACMATWGNAHYNASKQSVLNEMQQHLKLPSTTVNNALKNISTFYAVNKDRIAYFNSKSLIQNFYDNSSKMVIKLISRNSKRLYDELKNSKELMVLLSQSTIRDLSTEEQKKVQEQLLDIFKSIPSLAIFLLPGGALLLPLVIKFIPRLLPSAFDDNRIDSNS